MEIMAAEYRYCLSDPASNDKTGKLSDGKILENHYMS